MTQVEMLSGRRKKDYGAESAAEALAMQAAGLGVAPHELAAATADQVLDDDSRSANRSTTVPPVRGSNAW